MLIGLSGYAQSGKDSVAEVLVRDFGFIRIAFADKIKELLYEMNPEIDQTKLRELVDADSWDEIKQNPKVRKLLQDLGVGARVIFGEDFWVKQALAGMIDRKKYNYVITDVRFPNEMEAIWALNGKIWRVERPGVGPVNDHISEHASKGIEEDCYISNSGTLETLRGTVRNLMRHVG